MRSDGFVQELLDPAQNARDIGPLGVGGDGVREELGHRPHAAELVGPLVGEDGLVDAVHQRGTGQEGDLLVVVHHQHLDRPLPGPDELEALQAAKRVEVHVPFSAEGPEVIHGLPHCVNKSALLLHGHLAGLASDRVDRQRLLEVAEDIDVGDDQAVVLVGEHAVGAGDRLHQGVIPERLVEVDGRQRGHVEPGRPHRADERDAERVLGVLELLLQPLLDHALAVGLDVEPAVRHLGDLVLRLRDHDGHVGVAHEADLALHQVRLLRRQVTLAAVPAGSSRFAPPRSAAPCRRFGRR